MNEHSIHPAVDQSLLTRSALLFCGALLLSSCGDPGGVEEPFSENDSLESVEQASTRRVCSQFWGVTGQSCYWAGGEDGDVVCDDEYGWIPYCYNVQEATTPMPIYRSRNLTTNRHEYGTTTALSTGFVSEGVVFSLANDDYAGAIRFNLGSRSGIRVAWFHVSIPDSQPVYYFPPNAPNAIPNLVPLYLFSNPHRGDALYTLDPNGGRTLPCNIQGHPSGGPTLDCWLGGGVIGYVGRPQ